MMPKIEKVHRDYDEDNTNYIGNYTLMRDKNGKVVYQCKTCGRQFTNAKDFLNHRHDENTPKVHPKPIKYEQERKHIEDMLDDYGVYKKDVEIAISTLVHEGTGLNAQHKPVYRCKFDGVETDDPLLLEYHILTMHKKIIDGIVEKLAYGENFEGEEKDYSEEAKNVEEILRSYGKYADRAAAILDRLTRESVGMHNGNFHFICPVDNSEFPAEELLDQHILTVHKNLINTYIIREIREEREKAKQEREKKKSTMSKAVPHWNSRFTPEEIDAMFKKFINMSKYRVNKFGVQLYRCPIEGHTTEYSDPEDLVTHFVNKHNETELYWLVTNRAHIQHHNLSAMFPEPVPDADVSEKQARENARRLLVDHNRYRVSTGENRERYMSYKCPHCGLEFKDVKEGAKHLLEKDPSRFKGATIKDKFREAIAEMKANEHEVTNERLGEYYYRCPICGKHFKDLDEATDHLLTEDPTRVKEAEYASKRRQGYKREM
ncbi:MAG: C2H2-type zinc finger protein [Candidatus Parvarchaeum sp.]